VLLTAATVGGTLDLDGAEYVPQPGAKATAATATIDLSDTTATVVKHTLPTKGRPPTRIIIDRLSYKRLDPMQSRDRRLVWLRKSLGSEYRPLPYEQLAAHYREQGQSDDARDVLHAKLKAERRGVRPLHWLLNMFSGNGFKPRRAAFWLVAVYLVGFGVLNLHRPPAITNYPNLALYTLDVLMPTSPFNQENLPTLDATGHWTAVGLQAMGWLLSLAVIPLVARSFNRD